MFYYANHEQLKRKTSWYSTSFQNVLGAGQSVHEPLLPFSCLIGIREREEAEDPPLPPSRSPQAPWPLSLKLYPSTATVKWQVLLAKPTPAKSFAQM